MCDAIHGQPLTVLPAGQEDVPWKVKQGEGEDGQCCVVDEGVEFTEDNVGIGWGGGEGIADVDGGEIEDNGGHQEVAETEITKQHVTWRFQVFLKLFNGGINNIVEDYANEAQSH